MLFSEFDDQPDWEGNHETSFAEKSLGFPFAALDLEGQSSFVVSELIALAAGEREDGNFLISAIVLSDPLMRKQLAEEIFCALVQVSKNSVSFGEDFDEALFLAARLLEQYGELEGAQLLDQALADNVEKLATPAHQIRALFRMQQVYQEAGLVDRAAYYKEQTYHHLLDAKELVDFGVLPILSEVARSEIQFLNDFSAEPPKANISNLIAEHIVCCLEHRKYQDATHRQHEIGLDALGSAAQVFVAYANTGSEPARSPLTTYEALTQRCLEAPPSALTARLLLQSAQFFIAEGDEEQAQFLLEEALQRAHDDITVDTKSLREEIESVTNRLLRGFE